MPTPKLHALQDLDRDLQQSLLAQIRDLWTHSSTALEGNSLSLGETKFIIEEGLTISGKPIKDHQEVIGHARAIELIYQSLSSPLDTARLFDLHRAVQTEVVADIYKPHGAWKVEPNGSYAVDDEGQQVFIEYAAPADVPALMDIWLTELNRLSEATLSEDTALAAYAKLHLGFVHIHPFWDGNGRLARLLSNIPLLRSGHLPVVISVENRREYIDILARYERHLGPLDTRSGVWPEGAPLAAFTGFCQRVYKATQALLSRAREQQAKRDAASL